MTLIVAGRMEEKCFAMVDCVSVSNDTGEKSFHEKLLNLPSIENSFYTLAGNSFVSQALFIFDTWLQIKNIEPDYFTGQKAISDFIIAIERMISVAPKQFSLKLGYNKIFFIAKNMVVYHEIIYNENKLERYLGPVEIPVNYYSDSTVPAAFHQIDSKSKDLEVFCRKKLEILTELKREIPLMDRYSYVEFSNNGLVWKRPFKHFSDMVAEYFGINYSVIDDEGFVFSFEERTKT